MVIQRKNKQIVRQKIGHVGETVLLSLFAIGAISTLMIFPMLSVVIAPLIKKKKYSSKQIIQRNVSSLIRLRLIEKVIMEDGSIHIQLTQKGKWEAFLRSRSKDGQSQNNQKKKWDKVWRVVIFDVPISKNKIRVELRRAMRLYGFKMLQQSVWVYPHPCDDFVELIKSHLRVASNVLYMKVGYIENDKYLRNEFKI